MMNNQIKTIIKRELYLKLNWLLIKWEKLPFWRFGEVDWISGM